jgi:hypothetical protein
MRGKRLPPTNEVEVEPESELSRFLAANPSIDMSVEPVPSIERHRFAAYRHMRLSSVPHDTCYGCPQVPCPLRYYINPVGGCVFRRIVEARVK